MYPESSSRNPCVFFGICWLTKCKNNSIAQCTSHFWPICSPGAWNQRRHNGILVSKVRTTASPPQVERLRQKARQMDNDRNARLQDKEDKGGRSIVEVRGHRISFLTLQWRHNEHDGVSDHQPHDCLLKSLFRRRSKKTSKLRVTGLCEGNSPVTGEFPAQRASNAITGLCEGNSPVTGEFPAQRASNAEMFLFDDVIMILIGPCEMRL